MLKMKINKAKSIEIVAGGDIPTIVSELLLGIKTLKDRMALQDECIAEAFVETIKKGLDVIDDLEEELDTEEKVDEKVNELVDKALEDDDFLEVIMEAIHDELKVDFAKRMKERARMGKTEMKTETEAEEK